MNTGLDSGKRFAVPFRLVSKPLVPEWVRYLGEPTSVRLSELYATQPEVNRETVERYVQNGWTKRPVIFSIRNRLLIDDGHHRLTAAKLRGEPSADVLLVMF